MNNLMRLSEKMTNFSSKVSINSVTDPEEDFNEYVNYFKSNKIFNDIKVHYDRIDTSRLKYDLLDNPQYIVESNKAKLRDYLKLMCDKKIDMSKADNTVGEIAGSYYYFMLKKKLNAKEHHRGPCVPGVRKLFVTTEGNLLPCEKVSEESYSMIIGNVKEGFFYDKIHKLLNIGKLTEKDCINCTCIRHCSICAKEIDNIIDLDADIKRNVCKAKKLFLKEQIEKHIIYKQVGLFDYIEG